ncbi:RING-HC finger protein [Streptomyces sp. 1222.5]
MVQCPVCYNNLRNQHFFALVCGHPICENCVGQLQRQECPICRTPIDDEAITPNTIEGVGLGAEFDDTKWNAWRDSRDQSK